MIVLDTHIWLWWIGEKHESLRPSWIEVIDSADAVGVSAMSLFEVSWLHHHQRIRLPVSPVAWFEKALVNSGIELLPITPDIADCAVALPEHHRDPQDRIIIATAICGNARLISADTAFSKYRELSGVLID